jgi:hypothetical protein
MDQQRFVPRKARPLPRALALTEQLLLAASTKCAGMVVASR